MGPGTDGNETNDNVAPSIQVAYIMSRFPKVSETFILMEMERVRDRGAEITVYALRREKAKVVHPEAEAWLASATFGRLLSRELLWSQWYWLRRTPRAYLRMWRDAVVANVRAPGSLLRALYVLPNAAGFARRMKREAVEHVHAHYATHPALAAWAIGRLTGIPYSVTAHSYDLYIHPEMVREKLGEAAFVVPISQFNEQLIRRWATPRETHVIHTGADLRTFQPVAVPRHDNFMIVAVGRLEVYKGHSDLIEACAILVGRGLDIRCVIVGEGPIRADLERSVLNHGLLDRVTLPGAATRTGVRDWLAGADAFAMPSVRVTSGKMEGIPVVLMEAMAMRVPVVATRLSGIPELVIEGETGLLVPEHDPHGLADALERLARDPALRARLARAGSELVAREFDVDQSAARLAALFARSRENSRLNAS